MQVLINILKRNKKKLFGGAISGLPKMTYLDSTMPSADQVYQVSGQVATAAMNYGTEFATNKGKCVKFNKSKYS